MLIQLHERTLNVANRSDAKYLTDKFKLLTLLMNEQRGLIQSNKCKQCGVSMTGRSDKKFCNGICRSAFNNKKVPNNLHLLD